MSMNRQSRRATFGTVTKGAALLAAAFMLQGGGCQSTVTSLGAAAASGAMTAIVARGQAIVTALTTAATQIGPNLSASAQAAIARVTGAATTIAGLVVTGAAAVAGAVHSTSISSLAVTAGNILLGILQLIPGLGTLVSIVRDAIAVAPTLIGFAQSITNPTAAGAVVDDGGAARRLGVVA